MNLISFKIWTSLQCLKCYGLQKGSKCCSFIVISVQYTAIQFISHASNSSYLPVEFWNNFADSLGSTSGRWDNVLGSCSATSPVLGAGAVNDLLGGCVGVHGGHEPFNNDEIVVDDLGQWSQTVGGARCVATIQSVHWATDSTKTQHCI